MLSDESRPLNAWPLYLTTQALPSIAQSKLFIAPVKYGMRVALKQILLDWIAATVQQLPEF
jgi:hypothetical protein